MLKYAIIFCLLLSVSLAIVYPTEHHCHECDCGKNGNGCKNVYDAIIVGGGAGGISASYMIDLANRLSESSSAGLNKIDLSNILLIEQNSVLGGDAQSAEAPITDAQGIQLSKDLYDYDGPFVYDLGPQRIPLLTTRLQRSLAVDAGTLLEGMPYTTREDTRGRIARCPDSDFSNYSPGNPYGMPSACTSSVEGFVGDTSIPWSYDDNNGIGPAFNLTLVQDWAYTQGDAGSFAINAYILGFGGSPNPVTCDVEGMSCVKCGDCFVDTTDDDGEFLRGRCHDYLNVKTALVGTMGHEVYEFFLQDYAGFYADTEEGLYNPCVWSASYWNREFDTNTVNMYPVGSFLKSLDDLAQPIINQGTVLLNTRVTDISSAGNYNSAIVTTESGKKYRGKFVIYAGQPEHISSGQITGNLMDEVVVKDEFNSVYSVDVITVSISIENIFWDFDLPLNVSGVTSEWTLLRSFGNEGCTPRLEIRSSPYGNAMKVFRWSYTDYICKEIFDNIIEKVNNGDPTINEQLWRTARDDIAYIFEIDRDTLDESSINKMEYYINGWYYVYSNSTFTATEITEWSADPAGGNKPLCFAQEAWEPEFLGWAEASMRTAQQCIDRLIPGSSDLIECWMYNLFPPCDPVGSCYNNESANILGTETIIPSKYCNERWWINDFHETPLCYHDGINFDKQARLSCPV